MRYILLSILIFINVIIANAQQYPPVKDGSNAIELKVNDITDQYDKELAMTAKQKALFRLKVEDYLILKQEIEAKYEGREELNALTELQIQETLDMNDILTRIQMQVYKRVKPKIQPLKIVEPKK